MSAINNVNNAAQTGVAASSGVSSNTSTHSLQHDLTIATNFIDYLEQLSPNEPGVSQALILADKAFSIISLAIKDGQSSLTPAQEEEIGDPCDPNSIFSQLTNIVNKLPESSQLSKLITCFLPHFFNIWFDALAKSN